LINRDDVVDYPGLSADPGASVSPLATVTTVRQSITFTCNRSGRPLPNIAYWTLANGAKHYPAADQKTEDTETRFKVNHVCSIFWYFIFLK